MTLSEAINKMIQTAFEGAEITSANPTHINRLIQLNQVENPDLEDEIRDSLSDSAIQENKDIQDNIKKVKKMDAGNVGDIARMSTEQYGNIKQIAMDPAGFVFGAIAKKIPKIAKGGFVAGLVLLVAEEVTKLIATELQKPGRPFDIRLKRKIQDEIMIFRRREEKAKLLRGFSRVIITSMPRLRGGQFQTSDTYRMLGGGGSIPGGQSGIGAPAASPSGGAYLPPNEAGSIELFPTKASPLGFGKHMGGRRTGRGPGY